MGRGPKSWRYDAGMVAGLLGVSRYRLRGIVRRGEIDLGDFGSVVRAVSGEMVREAVRKERESLLEWLDGCPAGR